MDTNRFDAITRALAGASTRRAALKTAFGGAVASLVAAAPALDAAAKDKKGKSVKKVVICYPTGNLNRPYRTKKVAKKAVKNFKARGAIVGRACPQKPDYDSCSSDWHCHCGCCTDGKCTCGGNPPPPPAKCPDTCKCGCEADGKTCKQCPPPKCPDSCACGCKEDGKTCKECPQCIENGEVCPGGKAELCCSKHVCKNGKCGYPDGTPCKSADECCSKEMCHGKCGKCPDTCPPPKTKCDHKCTDLSDDPHNCGCCGTRCPGNEACNSGVCQDRQCLPVSGIGGTAELVCGEGVELTADASELTAGQIFFEAPSGTTFAEIRSLVAEFEITEGTCGCGSPRFSFLFENLPNLFAAVPNDRCGTGNSGNLIENTADDFTVWSNNGNTVSGYQEALDMYGDEEIQEIFLILDASCGNDQAGVFNGCVQVGPAPQQ